MQLGTKVLAQYDTVRDHIELRASQPPNQNAVIDHCKTVHLENSKLDTSHGHARVWGEIICMDPYPATSGRQAVYYPDKHIYWMEGQQISKAPLVEMHGRFIKVLQGPIS